MEKAYKILVIDDDAIFRKTLRFALERMKFDVVVADSGEYGIEIAKKLRPDLILCDVVMDGLHGFATVQRLQRDSRTENIPVIIMTGTGTSFGEQRAMAYGVQRYITKPFKLQELKRTIHAILGDDAV